MYEIVKSPIGRFDTYQLTHKETGSFLEIIADLGASINELQIPDRNGSLVSMVSGYRSDSEIRNGHHSKFAGSKLSPFPNRLAAGKYVFEGNEYQLPVNEIDLNNNLHAILHWRSFQVKDSSAGENSAVLVLQYEYKGTDQGYPFPYDIEIKYEFTLEGTTITTEVRNTGDSNMPVGDGWHPYFQFQDISNVDLQLGPANRVSSLAGNANGSVHGFENGKLIGDSKLDDCFLVEASERFEVALRDGATGIQLTCWQESQKGQYQYLQLYTPPNRKEIAVEPVTCPPNAFNSEDGLIVLKPNEEMKLQVGIEVKSD